MSNSFRNDGRRGGGIAVVYKDTFSIKQINEKHLNTYHSAKWRLSKKNLQLHIIGIYRPPPSESNMTSVAQFTDEFLYELQEDIKDSANLMVLGDFNIHINDTNDTDAQKFKDSTEAMGLDQHVDTYTHKQGNILDHIYMLVGEEPTVTYCGTSSFVTSWDKTSHMLQNVKWQKFAFFSEKSKYVHFMFSSKTKCLCKFLSLKLIFSLFC